MSKRLEGQSCQVCHSYLFDDDDMVFCPVCGAPHHRDCYNSLGHCVLHEDHGSDRQYKKEDYETQTESQNENNSVNCPTCGKANGEGTLFCPYCGNSMHASARESRPFGAGMGAHFAYIDPYGGVSPDENIDVAKVEDIKNFVVLNTQRYIPKFKRLSSKKKVSWNFAAFLFPSGWFLFRKQYKMGIMTALLLIAATICSIPLSISLSEIQSTLPIGTSASYYSLLLNHIDEIGGYPLAVAFIGGILQIIIGVVSGLFGDYLYRQHTISTIVSIRNDARIDDYNAEFRKKGGVSPALFLVAVLCIEWVPFLIVSFI